MTTRVKSYRINTDENVRKGDAIVIGDDGEMTGQHLGTAASLDNGTCPGNVPILDSNGKLPDSLTPTSVMKKCVYDPHPELHEQGNDVFDYDNFYNTPTIPEVYDPTITFVQGGVNRGSISLNQASGGTIELMAGGLDAGVATGINNNAIDVNVDETSVNVNSNNKLCVVDYDTIKSGAAAGATAVQENDLATVAMTGNYCDLINKPEIPSAQIQSDWAQTNVNLADYIKNKPTIGNATITLQKNGSNVDTFELNQTADKCINLVLSKSDVGLANVDNTSDADKPVSDATLCALACKQDNISDLNTIRSNACAGKIASETIANYGDIVTHNSCEYATSTQGGKADTAVQPGDLCTVATTGCYCDLTGRPTIGSATITIQKNGTCVDTFNTNATTAKCINITMDKTDVGLANVDNTSDINKPVSTATQAALDCKQDVISDLATICSNASAGAGAATTIASYGDIVTHDTCEFASCAQGAKADTAVQPSQLCTVATTGKYCDLTGTPLLCAVATSAQYCDLLGAPSLCTVATSGKYCDLSGTPNLCTVATSGKYCDLSGLPTIPTDNCQLSNSCGYTTCTGTVVASDLEPYAKSCTLCTVATSGKYCDLSGKPTIPTDNCQLANGCGYTTCTGTLVASDLNPYAKTCNLCTVATTGRYCDLTGAPALCNIATSGEYCDLSGIPTIPTDNCELANSCGYTTCTGTLVANDLQPYAKSCDLCTVSTSGKYCDLSGTPALCTVATSGKYCDLTGKPSLCAVATSGKYCDLTGTPSEVTTSDMITGTSTTLGVVSAKGVADYVSCRVSNLYKYKGSRDCYCDLPGTGNVTGDTYNVKCAYGDYPAGTNYSWNGTDWDPLGGSIDLSGYAECCDIPTDNCQLSNSCGYTTCTGTLVASDLNPYAKSCTLCAVATSGKYCDLTGKPAIPTDNCQLANSCGYTTCTGTLVASDLNPYAKSCTLCTVATSGKYCDLTGKPTIPTDNCQLSNSCGYTTCTGTVVLNDLNAYAKCCDLKTVATSGKYCDLSGTPTIPTDNCQLSNSCGYTTCTGTLVASDLNPYAKSCDVIKCKSTTGSQTVCTTASGCTTAFGVKSNATSSYISLSNCAGWLASIGAASDKKPTWYNGTGHTLAYAEDIPTNNNQLTNGCGYTTCTGTLVASDLQPYAKSCDLKAVATSGAYCDLTGIPTIPTDNCQLANGCGYTTCTGTLVAGDLTPYTKACTLCTVATSGKYCDLTGKPSLATVATSGKYCDLTGTPDLSGYALSCNMVCTLDGADNDHYPTTLAVANALGSAGYGDMLKATYDPCNCAKDAFNYNNLYNKPTLCTVATSGKYCDLSGTPSLATVATSGCYNDLTGKPSLCTIATSGKYCDLSGTPSLATVATTGCYNDLTGKPTIPTKVSQLTNDCNYINKDVNNLTCYTPTASLATVATSGAYCDLTGTPTLSCVACSGCYDDLTGKPNLGVYQRTCNMVCTLTGADDSHYPTAKTVADALSACGAGDMLKSTYDPNNKNSDAFDYCNFINTPSLCTVATSGKYCDLTGKPTIPSELTSGCAIGISSNKINVQYDGTTIKKNSGNCLYADFTGLATTSELACKANSADLAAVATSGLYCDVSGTPTLCTVATSGKYCDLSGTPSLCTVATSGKYCDLTGKPSLCTVATSGKYCDLTGTPSLATVATTGCYNDLTGKPTIPTVNTKTFTLSSTSDTANASTAAAYINDGNNAIILLSGQTYQLTSKSSSSMVFKSSVTSTGGTSDTELKQNTLTFTVIGNTVTAISNTATSLGKYLQTDKNYGTAYTPLYNGSPATKKYVDDCVGAINSAEWGNITGTMSCQTDLTNALACKAQCCDIPTNNNQLTNGCGYTTCTGTLVSSDLAPYACSCDVLTKTNTTSYTPSSNYHPATKKYVDDAVAGAGGGDMCYADFNPVSKSGASITLDLYSTLTPTANFTVNKPSTVKAGQVYVLRVTNSSTAYTMSLGTGVENPFGVDLVLTPNGTDQFTFYGTSSSTLELQKDYDDENIFVTQDEYESLPSTKLTDNKTYFIYEEE